MIESRLQTGHRRMMFSSQSSAQSTSSFSGGTETGIKRTVTSRALPRRRPAKISAGSGARLLKKIQLKEKYKLSSRESLRPLRRFGRLSLTLQTLAFNPLGDYPVA